MILIIGTSWLEECDRVQKALVNRNEPIFRLNLDRLSEDLTVGVVWSDGSWKAVIKSIEQHLDLAHVTAAWVATLLFELQSPKDFTMSHDRGQSDLLASEFAANENRTLVCYLLNDLTAPVLSRPIDVWRASNRLQQLRAAVESGFAIPETVFSNDATTIRQFSRGHTSLVYKPIDHASIPIRATADAMVYTSRYVQEELSDDEMLQTCMGTYQRAIDKEYELRVTIIGRRVYAARITAVAESPCDIDWRYLDPAIAEHRAVDLPDKLQRSCLELMDRLDLDFASLDIVAGKDGRSYFLEANPIASWASVELLTGLPISEGIADWLCAHIK